MQKNKKNLIFVDTNDNLDSIKKYDSDATIFSFNIHTHKHLEKRGIEHQIGEDYLSVDDHHKVFDKTVSYWNWYETNEVFKKLDIDGVNLLSVFDTAELHQVIIRELSVFLTMKRIIEKNQPEKIFTSFHFAKLLEPLTRNSHIKIEVLLESKHEFSIPWNKFLIKFNLGKIPISFTISRKSYDKIRNFLESIVGNILHLWPNKKFNQEMILFVEFDPSQYSDLIQELNKNGNKILFVNRRRTAIWNFDSIKLLQNTDCKIVSPRKFLTNYEITNSKKLSENLLKEVEKIWVNNLNIFESTFSIENFTFWPSISEIILQIFRDRIFEYTLLIKFSTKLLNSFNFKSIITLNTMGETEKTILSINNKKIPSVLLEHGASDYLPEISRHDVTSGYRNFDDKIAVWSKFQKDYLINTRKIPQDQIFVTGSPRHDSFFTKNIPKNSNKKSILITIPAIPEMNFLSDTNSFIKLENLLKKIFSITTTLQNTSVIVKLHPVQDENNAYVKKLIQSLEPNILILQAGSIKEIISSCDLMINIHVELMPSTVLLEGLILKKPIIDVVMPNEILEFQYVKDNAVLSITDYSNLETMINELLDNKNISEKFIENGNVHVKKFLSNPGNASKSLADVINSI